MKTIYNKTLQILGSLGIAAILFTACSPSAHIEKDDSVDLGKYNSFAWLDKDGSGKADRNRGNELQEKKVREAVNGELKKQGWSEAKTRPDVFLSYDVVVENSSKKQSDPVYSDSHIRTFYNPYTRRWVNVYYPSRFLGYNNYAVRVKEGTITISMIDAHIDKVVWQGWVTDEVKNRNLTTNEIQSAVRSIFRKFDIAKK
jgi:hypothetical protein